jgi:hypothetical protein
VLTEALERHEAAAARPRGESEQRRQPPGVILEPLETEEFDRSWRTRSAAITRVPLVPVLAGIRTSLGIHSVIVSRRGRL